MNTSVSFTKSETNWCFSTGKVGVANLADRHALYWKVNKALPIIPWIEGIPLICLCCYLAVWMWRELLLSPSLPGTQSLCCCWASGSGWSASHSSSPGNQKTTQVSGDEQQRLQVQKCGPDFPLLLRSAYWACVSVSTPACFGKKTLY